MKLSNYQIIDFLDFDPEFDGTEVLWRAITPVKIESYKTDVIVTIPFQKQVPGIEIIPDRTTEAVNYRLRLRAYSDKMIRVSMDMGNGFPEDSEMMEWHPAMVIEPLSIRKEEKEWLVVDSNGLTRALFSFVEVEIEHWSDLLPAPEPTLNVTFYPDGKNAIPLSAYDQFFPARHEAFALAFVEKNDKIDRTTFSLAAGYDECFAGTGERFTKLDLSGKTMQLVNQDGQGVNNKRCYKNVPFFLSSRMYGAFIHTSAPMKLSIADHSSKSVQVLIEDASVDFFLMTGNDVNELLYQYRSITGFPTMPPLWSYGVWMSRMSYFSADEVNDICDRLRKENFPCDVIHMDTGWFRTDWLCEWKFNPERFPNPVKFISNLKKKGFKVSLWQMPYIASEAEQHDEAVANRYIGPVEEKLQQGGSNFSALDYAGTIDFTYPKAVKWYKGLLRDLLEMGVVCIKTDFGENIHQNARYHGMSAHLLNNLYGLLYQKAAYEITKEVTGDGIVWARAGWAGCQRYPVHWGGDAAASWEGLAGSLKGGLHLGLSGFAFWSHDVPGFHGVPNFMNSIIPDKLYMRWTQFGVFTSHIRYHGTSKREPYEFPAIADLVRKWFILRYALIPYIVRESEKCTQNGLSVLRPLICHHANDRTVWHIDDQYYFGDYLIVAPVMNDEDVRDVYLPEGEWIHLFTGDRYEGATWLQAMETPLEQMPVWIKKGTTLPLYLEPVSNTDEMEMEKVQKVVIDSGFTGIFNLLNL